MAGLLRELRNRYYLILLDTPPLSAGYRRGRSSNPPTDGAVLVCRFRQTRLVQVQDAIQALKAVSVPAFGNCIHDGPNNGHVHTHVTMPTMLKYIARRRADRQERIESCRRSWCQCN